MFINQKEKSYPIKKEIVTGFIGGLNLFQDQTVIKEGELTEAKNVVLSVDGVEPRHGTLNYGDTSSDTKIYGMLGFYLSNGTRQFLRISGGRMKKYVSGSWTSVDSTAFSSVNTVLLQARDKVYCFNGTDDLRVWDGTSMTTYTALTTPAGLGVTATGTTGSTAYSYRVSAFNANGETLACTAVAIANGNATLSNTNYNALSWTAVGSAVGYNVWGNKATGLGETYLSTVYTNSYNDKGIDTPSITLLPPEGNTTGGIKGKYACFAISRIFVAGDSNNPSRLYWGGVGTNLANFSSAPEGGGYVDVFKNDGAAIRAIVPFQGGVIVGKDNGIYKFSFTDAGLPRLEEITRSFGMISHKASRQVENDIIFPARKDGRLAFYSLGNQENFTASVLRSNELSIKNSPLLSNVNLQYLENADSFYFNDIYGCAIPKTGSSENDRIWCLDTRFGAWVYWEDLSPNCFAAYVDTDGSESLYFGHSSNGYVVEMFVDDRNDNNEAISVAWATKSFSQEAPMTYKHYLDPTFQFKNINQSGAISGQIIVDGAIQEKDFSVTTGSLGGAGFGAMLFGQPLFGESTGGTAADVSSADQVIETFLNNIDGRYIKYSFSSSSKNLRFKFLSLQHAYQTLEGKRLPSTSRVY